MELSIGIEITLVTKYQGWFPQTARIVGAAKALLAFERGCVVAAKQGYHLRQSKRKLSFVVGF